MGAKKWSWSEKILFLTPLLFVVAASWTFLTPRDRVFRADILKRTIGEPFRARESDCRGTCASRLKHIGLSLLQYAKDNGEKFPPAQTGGQFYGWADATFPYLKSTQIFQCPQAPTKPTTSPRRSGYTSFYFNNQLSARNRDASNVTQLILAGEGDDGLDIADARYSKSSWPLAWEANRQSPLFRHLTDEVWAEQGSFFVFADGHVKWLLPPQFRHGNFTFQPQ